MKQLFLAAALLLGACASTPAQAPLLHYVRSNQDGTMPEHIYVYVAAADRIEVGKMVRPCTNAAFVTAELDRPRGQARALVGGRLARDGAQEAFAWLSYDPETQRLHARVPPAGIDQDVAIAGEPWMMYDFDLADLSGLNYGRAPARVDFRFAIALIWPEDGAEEIFRDLGYMQARFVGVEQRHERQTLRFEVSGGLTGQLWLDARQGFVVEARFDQPNHTGYDNFQLVLLDVAANGAEAWQEVRAQHWENCD